MPSTRRWPAPTSSSGSSTPKVKQKKRESFFFKFLPRRRKKNSPLFTFPLKKNTTTTTKTALEASDAAKKSTVLPDHVVAAITNLGFDDSILQIVKDAAAAAKAEAQASREALEEAGYVAIGLDHFARPDDDMAIAARSGELHRNFQGYTVDGADALLPLGASSIGRLPQGYVQNAPDLAGWRRAIEAGSLPVAKGRAFTDDDLLRSRVIERLMCDFAVDFGQLARDAGDEAALDGAIASLDALADDGIIQRDGRIVRMTPHGQPFVRLAAAAFDAYLESGAARHSVAV